LSAETIDALIKDAKATGTPLDGVGGLLSQMTTAVLERALQTEVVNHLGYDSGDPAGHGSGNSRNGKSRKTVATAKEPIEIDVPRDRNGSFELVRAGDRGRNVRVVSAISTI
jgi:putative transposase